MMKQTKWISIALTICLLLALSACGSGSTVETATSTTKTGVTEESQTETASSGDETAAEKQTVNVAMLSGPTGIGAVKLMADSDAGNASENYQFSVLTSNDEAFSALTSGEVDIAALSTNVAANLYNKTSGAVQIAAINTLGVLYILENGDTVSSISDLKGKTIYTTGQGANPEYILDYILTQNGLTPGTDVDIVFSTADDVVSKMVSGEASVCMLPVPAATALQLKGSARVALDVNDEWAALGQDSTLPMGCVVVRTEFAEAHPDLVSAFLEEYADSIDYVQNNVEAASELVAQYQITASAAIAAQAIPDCNLVCITGADDIRSAIQGYYQVLYAANPDSIGGNIPDDAFYFG
ncbi:MAG: periplasmic component of ABC-type nitrate/sulfonate/bicarbonate transport system [Oscillospiraceae bacterium]|nr:periplasmic component of ABC-type nitrate/sulfonate/bicarbonate transport system [Oscillospiraceae bacterium]